MRALWQKLVAQRRQTLEDAFKIDLSVKAGENEVKIEEVTPLWEETMLRAWQHYLGLCPLKSRNENSWVPESQISQGSTQRQSLFYPGLDPGPGPLLFHALGGCDYATETFLICPYGAQMLCLPAGGEEGWKYQPSRQFAIVSLRDQLLVQGSG